MTPFGKRTEHPDGTYHIDRVRRITVAELGGSFGSDKDKRLVVALLQGDLIEVRPERTQRPETVTAADLYRILIQRRVQNRTLEKARSRKQKLAALLERASIKRAEKKLTQ